MRRKFTGEEKRYWANVLTASSQITLGAVWASLLLPIDNYQTSMIILNSLLTALFWMSGWLFIRRVENGH